MSRALLKAVKAYCRKNRELATTDGAMGQCFMASVDLQQYLLDRGVLRGPQFKAWDVEQIARTPHYEVQFPWSNHWALRVGKTLIDVTARQFDASLPYPLVMDLADAVLA